MIKGPQPDRLEFAILQIVMSFAGKHQTSWGEWGKNITRLVPDWSDDAELKAAFKRLRTRGILQLWKYNGGRPWDYSEVGNDDESFFSIGPFGATITDEGRSHWGTLNLPQRERVFISHITEEKPVAEVLQKYVKQAFYDKVPVFVSSDGKSIGGGKKWYNHIIDNLRLSEVILVLISQESRARPWINFEAGFGEGLEALVIPVTIKNTSLGQLLWPLQGIQARSIDRVSDILEDIGERIGQTPQPIDLTAFALELEEAEAQLIYKSLTIEPVVENISLYFNLQNVGNIDLELLMFEVLVPELVLNPNFQPYLGRGVDIAWQTRNGIVYATMSCFSGRGAYNDITPILRPVITPSMRTLRPPFGIRIQTNLEPSKLELPIFFQAHVIGYQTQEEERRISDIKNWS